MEVVRSGWVFGGELIMVLMDWMRVGVREEGGKGSLRFFFEYLEDKLVKY